MFANKSEKNGGPVLWRIVEILAEVSFSAVRLMMMKMTRTDETNSFSFRNFVTARVKVFDGHLDSKFSPGISCL